MSEQNPSTPDPTPWDGPHDPQADPALTPAGAQGVPAEPSPPGHSPEAPKPAGAPPKKSHRGRKWLIGAGIAALLLILLVLLLPTIASTGPVRSIVVRQINNRLNGRVEIQSYSVGWTGGVRAAGVKLFDAEGRQILQLGRIDTGLSLWEILRGNYNAGKVTIEDLDFLARKEADGRLNFAKLMKDEGSQASGAPAQPPAPANPSSSSPRSSSPTQAASKLPDVSAEIILKNARGTYEDVVEKRTVQFTSIEGRVNIPNINAAIENALTVVANTPQNPSGTLKVNGTVDVIENNQVLADFAQASVNETVEIGNFALTGVAPIVLAAGGPIDKLDGLTSGNLSVVLTPGAGGAVQGQIVSDNFALGGPALHGDTFATRQLSLTIPKTTIALAPGQATWQDWRVVVGGDASAAKGKPEAVTLAFQQGSQPATVALAGQFTPRAVLNALDKKAPGGEGQFALTTNLDLGDLAAKLPRTFAALGEGVQLGQGRLALDTTAGYKGETLTLESHVALQNANVARAVPATVIAVATQPVPSVIPVLDDGSLKTDLALSGSFQNGAMRATLTQLSVSLLDKQSGTKPILSLTKGQGELAVTLPPSNAAPPTGRIDLAADLARLSQISRGFSNDPNRLTTAPGQSAQLRRGDLAGSVGFGRTGDNLVQLTSQLNVTNIDVDVPTGGKPIRGEQLALTLAAKARDDFSQVIIDDLTATGRLLNGKVTDTELRLASGGGGMPVDNWSLVQRASVELNFPELGQLQDFVDSVRPPEMKAKPARAGFAAAPAVPKPDSVLLASAAPLHDLVAVAQADPRGSDVIGSRRPPARPSGSDRISSPPRRQDQPQQQQQQQPQQRPSGSDRISSPPPPDRGVQSDRNRAAPPQSAPPRRAVPEVQPRPVPQAPAQVAQDQGDPGPTRLRDGSATVRVNVARQDGWLVVKPTLTARDVAYQTGSVYHPLGAVDVNLEARLVPAANVAPGASALAQVRELTIPTFKASVANSTVELTKPLSINDLAMAMKSFDASAAPGAAPTTKPSTQPAGGQLVRIDTALAATLDLGRLSAALEALKGARSGDGPDDPPYSGIARINQEIATGPEGIYLKGNGTIDDLRTGTRRDPGLSEQRLTLADDLALDTNASVLHLANLSVDAQASKAVQLAAKGIVRDFSTTRKLENVTVDLSYDAAKLWDLLRPMLESPEPGKKADDSSLKDIKLAGNDKTHLDLSGSYPAGLPFAEAARSLVAKGSLGLKQFDGYGIEVQNLGLGLDLRDGVLKLSHPSGLPDVNSGKANLGGLWVTLGTGDDPHPRLNAPPNHVLAEKVSLNPVLADSVIGKFVNPVFKDAAQAKGLVKLTLVQVKGFGLDYIRNSPIAAESGRAELLMSIDDLYLGVPNLAQAVNTAFPNAFNENGFAASIKDARIVVQGGQVWNDMTLTAEGKYAVGFGGGIGIRDLHMLNFGVNLPPSLIAKVNKDLAKVVPEKGFKVALRGTTENWTQSLSQNAVAIAQDLAQQAIRQNLAPENILGQVLGGNRRQDNNDNNGAARQAGERNTAQPPPKPEEVIGDLLQGALGGRKKETDAEKRERRERQREEKQQQQQQPAQQGGGGGGQ